MVDDMGYSDIGCYGGEVRTPNIDRLATGGLRFRQFYNNAKCGPTRASLLTGLYSQQAGSPKPTVANILRNAGYRTFMTGKWHQSGLPVQKGFDRYFGLTDGCCNFWNPGGERNGAMPGRKWSRWRRWAIDDKPIVPFTPKDPNFYTTDAFTDYALGYLDQYYGPKAPDGPDKPFFLYLAYTAPHYPLHAWPKDIAKYRELYRKTGWDTLRKERYARQIKMGVIDPKVCKLPARDASVAAWADVKDKDAEALKMAVYAAMIDRVDQNIGRVLAKVEALGKADNTLVLFLSDNGACSEVIHKGTDPKPGAEGGYHTLDPGWANATNTPFRKFKTWDFEGGTCTPLIAYWPAGIKRTGGFTDQAGHIIDILPTCAELAGAKTMPITNGGKPVTVRGKTLAPILAGKQREAHEAIYWQYGSSRAVRQGDWKLVTPRGEGDGWELYNIAADRSELVNLADKHPDRVVKMAAMWQAWRDGCAAPARTDGKRK